MSSVSRSFSISGTSLEDAFIVDHQNKPVEKAWFEGSGYLEELQGCFFEVQKKEEEIVITVPDDTVKKINDIEHVLDGIFETIKYAYRKMPTFAILWSKTDFKNMNGPDLYISKH